MELSVRRITDYHTVQNIKTASGILKPTHLTYRQYLCDATFACVLSGNANLINRLTNDERGAGFGKSNIGNLTGAKSLHPPTAPVLAGIFPDEAEALNELLRGQPLVAFTTNAKLNALKMATTLCSISPCALQHRMEYENLRRAGLSLMKHSNVGIGHAKAFGCGLLLVRHL